MKKVLFSILLGLLGFGVLGLLSPSPAQANCQMLNVSYEDFLRCVNNGAAPGGTTVSWLYRLSSKPEYQEMQQIIEWNNNNGGKYNFDVRLYVPGALPTNNQVDAFLSSLASLNSTTEMNARLVNEPNNLGNESLVSPYAPPGVVLDTARRVAARVYQIYEYAYSRLNQLKATDRVSLGLTLDHIAPYWLERGTVDAKTFLDLMNNAAGLEVIDKFYEWDVVWMINAYVYLNNPTQIGQHYNLATLRQDLYEILGVPFDMRIAIFEIGALRVGEGVVYDAPTLVALFTNQDFIQSLKDSGIEWFTIFISSPEPDEPGYYFLNLPRSVLEAFANFYSGKDPFFIGILTDAEVRELLELIQVLIDAGLIVACPEGGFATSLKECEEGVAPGFPGYSYYTASLQCESTSTGDRDSRPDACDPCNVTSYSTYSCATSFTVNDSIVYERKDGTPEEPHCLEEDWEGTVKIDASETTIPFVGKKRESNIDAREDEQKYLADYFEGTHEYYRTYDHSFNFPIIGEKTLLNGFSQTLIPNYSGVFRKLTPMEYQDELKKEMVQRAQKTVDSGGELEPGGVHDYKITYARRLCWDFSFWTEMTIAGAEKIAEFLDLLPGDRGKIFSALFNVAHYCLYDFDSDGLGLLSKTNDVLNAYNQTVFGGLLAINSEGIIDRVEKDLTEIGGHFPPDPSEENYAQKWQEWKDSEWGRVWEAVPMFSRDDTPGEIAPYYGIKSRDEPKYIPIQIEKVPHVARLFEETLELNELLLPQGTAGAPKFAQDERGNGPLIASAENNILGQETKAESCSPKNTNPEIEKVLGEKTYLAQSDEDTVPATVSIVLSTQGCIVKPFIRVNMCPAGTRENGVPYHVTLRCGSPWDGLNPNIFEQKEPGVWEGDYSCPGVDLSNMKVGESASLSVLAEKIDAQHCLPIENINLNCTITKNGDECGQFEADCATGPILEELCGIAGPSPVSDCFSEAIKDSNPNDRICGEPTECEKYQVIEFPFTAVDAFQNLRYLECGQEFYDDCRTNQLGIEICRDHCHDKITEEVNRRFGINLIHPYLNEIWNLSTNNETFGIFNIFRPAQIPPFEDIDASSEISYSYLDTSDPLGGIATPETGEFYFNHLGGVQKAKEWVTTKVLMPYVEQ